ncbi:dermonecrotic toxin domain-containing protein [Pseudomonas putida]|uniref:dermonecrotic toxin domain-containing protein n=1 Tax=Pseudomonas putida TaxID=303 RepID=UPI00383A5FB3
MPNSKIPPVVTLNTLDLTGLASGEHRLPGIGNLLLSARQSLRPAASQLRSLLSQAPNLQQTVREALHASLKVSPSACGLRNGSSQVTLLTFAVRLLANPVFANSFAGWRTWGFEEQTAYQQFTVAQWTSSLSPIVNAAKLNTTANYWAARMPGTYVSRQSHASTLLRQHLVSSLDIAYGEGTLSIDSWLQGRQSSPRYAQLQWQLATGRKLTSSVALLIAPTSGQTHWLIYIPGMRSSVHQLATLESLRDWIYLNRFRFWSDPRSPVTGGSRDDVLVSYVQGDGISLFLEEALRQHQEITEHYLQEACKDSETDPLDWTALQTWENQRCEMVLPPPDTTAQTALDEAVTDDAALAEEELHFSCLEQHLPAGWRHQLIERQETALEQYLGDDLELTSDKVSLLRERQTSLEQLQDSHDRYLLELPEPLTSTNLQTRVGAETRLEHIANGLSQALLKEARLQRTLGDLSATHLGWIEQLLDRPEPSLQRPLQASALELVGTGQKWQLRGYMTFRATPMDDQQSTDQTLLLYRPGLRGGLMAFADESELANRLLATLRGAWPDALLESMQPSEQMQVLKALSESPSLTIAQPAISSHFMQHCVASIVAALPTDSSREQTRQRLCISENRSRTAALARFAEKNRSSHLSGQLSSLSHLDANQLNALRTQTDKLKNALQASAELLKLSLPSREHFAQLKLNEHLRSAFALQNPPLITLDIADSVTMTREVTGQSALGGAGSREVPIFSQARSKVALASFMLWALDDDRRQRLNNASIEFEPAAEHALQRALTPAYLANLIEQLDIAGDYEKRIIRTYQGFDHESGWQVQWRQETLRAPYEIRLQLLALSRPTRLQADGQQLLEKFCSEQVGSGSARTVEYRSVTLKPGTAADGSSKSVGLAGIYLIKDATGPVLLYMPDAPNGRIISQYKNSSAACKALQDMALDRTMARYLATQSQSGSPDSHEQYINTALQQHFQNFITPGPKRSESLPTHECHLEMGEDIRTHRGTSRSQADLALAKPEIATRHLLLGLRIAFGILPGVGTAMALYDGWHEANAAVRSVARGDLEEGLQHLVSLLQSLTDAMLTLAPLAASPGNPAAKARLLTQQRQRLDPTRPLPTTRNTPPSPFAGYEAELPTGAVKPSTHPQGTGVLEHTATRQHYISRNGSWYLVEWDSTYLTWRLKPQGTRSYHQPVRLSEQGAWDTPGRLSGLLVDNGLAGGGGVLTTLYNHGVGYWRRAIRRQPPQLTGMDLAYDIYDKLNRARTSLRPLQQQYTTAIKAFPPDAQANDLQRAAIVDARERLSAGINQELELNRVSIMRLQEQRATLDRSKYKKFIETCMNNISEVSVLEMKLTLDRLDLAKDQVILATAATEALHGALAPAAQVQRLAQAELKATKELIDTLQEVERLSLRHHAWRNQLPENVRTTYLAKAEGVRLNLDVDNTRLVRAWFLSLTVINEYALTHSQTEAFMAHFREQGATFRSILSSHVSLPSAGLSRAQERAFLSNAQAHYNRYLSQVRSWEDNFSDLLSPSETAAFRKLMRQLVAGIEEQLDKASVSRQRPGTSTSRGPSRPRLFETAEGPLIGELVTEQGQSQERMRIKQPNSDGVHATYIKNEAGQWQKSTTEHAAPTQSLSTLVGAAQNRLNDITNQKTKLRSYQKADAIPRDLEDIAEGHAQQLRFIGNSLRQKAGQSITSAQTTLAQQLETAAVQMQALGRQLRIAQTKATQKPNVGYLEYLVGQQEVEIAWSRTLKPKLDGKGKPTEYLEEYRINDVGTGQPLWYAHFHFRQKPAQGFTRLEAGHLKLASERDLGTGAWRGSMTETQANRLFDNLRPVD